jgi:DNA-binding transcriptional LysR family regulator
MELRQLRHFPALVEERSITGAAKRELIVQSGLSNSVSAGVGIGFAPVGLQYPVLTAPDSVLPLIAVDGVRLERHIYLILPAAGETSPAALRFADQLLRIRSAGS